MTVKLSAGAASLLFVCLFPTAQAQATVIVGSVELMRSVEDRFYYGMGRADFTTSGGTVTIDVFGNGFTGGPSGTDLGDSILYLFANDGDIGTDDFLVGNDDSNSTFSDGSIRKADSFLSVSLAAGDYTAFVGQCCEYTVNSFTAQGFEFFRGTDPAAGDVIGLRDFQLTILGPGVAPTSTVPLPAALPLFLSALAGLGMAAWRRRPA